MRIPTRLRRSRHGVFYFRLVIPARFRQQSAATAKAQETFGALLASIFSAA